MSPAGLFGNSLAALTVPWLTVRETVALIFVALSLLFFRAFRERQSLIWGLGWSAFGAFLVLTRASEWHPASKAMAAFAQAEFVLVVGLFATAALLAAQARRALVILGAISGVLMLCAALQPLYFSDSAVARLAVEIACRIIAACAAFELFRSRLGRIGFGPFLFAAGLLTLNLSWPPFAARIAAEGYLLADVLFGSSLLLVALDDSRLRTRRLAVLNELSVALARDQTQAPIMQAVLEKLKTAARARAAWFRLMEGDNLVPIQHVGLSPEFLAAIGQVGMDEILSRVLEKNCASVVPAAETPFPVREQLRKHRIRHVVLVPVIGKKSVIGTLSLGFRLAHRHTLEELAFLETATQKLGMVAENLRLIEQVLRSERQWINTFDSIQDLILAHDSDFRILKANLALLERLQKAPVDVMGSLCESVLPRKHLWSGCPYCQRGSGLTEELDLCFGGRSAVSTSFYSEQGDLRKGTIHVVRDTTERHAAEEKYRMLFEQAQEGLFVAALEGNLLDCNDAFVSMLGYGSRQELMALDMTSVLGAGVAEGSAFRLELETHNFVRNFEMPARRKDGMLLTVALSCFATRDSSGRIVRYQGFVLDITEKKRSEDEMRRRNRELNALNALAVIATQSFDLDEILNLTLRQVVSLLGAETGSVYLAAGPDGTFRRRAEWGPKSEARARLAEVVFPEGLGDLVMRSRAEVITQDFLPHLPPALVGFVCADRLPHWIWVLLWNQDKPVGLMGIASKDDRTYSSNDENLLVSIGRQVATTVEKVHLYEEACRAYEDLRRTQAQLLQSEKMSAMGQLISGVAHELNNPLTAVLGYAQLLEGASLDDQSAGYVRKLGKQAQRTHRIVQNLLSFARQHKPQKQSVDLRRILDETITLREYDLKVNKIALVRDIPERIPFVVGDPNQLEQVFLNIINNAIDAMAEDNSSGLLTVRVFQDDASVCVQFNDSGPGIKDPSRIFDPFYTTKSIGKGTGLGMSICYGIVKEHRGEILARNREEGGATIEVRLPASAASPVPETVAPALRPTMLAGRVLLVEDEEAVLEFERDVLAGTGTEVTTSTNLQDAKERIRQGSFDVIVMNGRMAGGVTAPEVYQWIADNCPGMEKVLLLTFSGAIDDRTRTFLKEHDVPSLAKPFEVADLVSQIRSLTQKHAQAEAKGNEEKASGTAAGT